MLAIKLSKVGKTNKKVFRLIISEKGRDPFGRALEILGSYNPYSKEFQAKADRIKYWLSKGAQMTPTVNNLLIDQKVIEGKKVVASKPGTPKKKEESKGEDKAPEKKEVKAEESEENKEEVKAEEPKAEESEENKEEVKAEEPKAEESKEETKEEAPAKEEKK